MPQRRSAAEGMATRDRVGERLVRLTRPADRLTEVTPGGPPYRLLWCSLSEGSPGDPPDERYYADEVRPQGTGSDGRLVWEAAPGGLTHIVVHNVAEAAGRTHVLPVGTIVQVEERLDRSGPPNMVYLAHEPAETSRLGRIVSYDGTTYTVQPVVRELGGFVSDGPPVSGVANLGELWNDEKGYLAGPMGFDRIVPLVWTPAGWTIVLHPPRMV
jgi:hypothetical protein